MCKNKIKENNNNTDNNKILYGQLLYRTLVYLYLFHLVENNTNFTCSFKMFSKIVLDNTEHHNLITVN